jgi:hypothetical protein
MVFAAWLLLIVPGAGGALLGWRVLRAGWGLPRRRPGDWIATLLFAALMAVLGVAGVFFPCNYPLLPARSLDYLLVFVSTAGVAYAAVTLVTLLWYRPASQSRID